MTITTMYAQAASKAQDIVVGATNAWARTLAKVFGQASTEGRGPYFDPDIRVDWYFDTAVELLEEQRTYVKRVAGSMSSISGAYRDRVMSMSSTLRNQASAASDIMRERSEQAERVARERANAAELEARAAAAEKFVDLTRPELQDELEKRNLPRKGTVEELRGQLIEAELHESSS